MGGATRSRAAAPATGAGRPEPRAERREPFPKWRERLRYAVDLAVAFATLRDTEPVRTTGTSDETAGAAACSGTRASADVVGSTENRAETGGPLDRVHPHRIPLRPPTRPRRPGAAVPRVQPCLSPVEGAAPRLPRRRSRDLGIAPH